MDEINESEELIGEMFGLYGGAAITCNYNSVNLTLYCNSFVYSCRVGSIAGVAHSAVKQLITIVRVRYVVNTFVANVRHAYVKLIERFEGNL